MNQERKVKFNLGARDGSGICDIDETGKGDCEEPTVQAKTPLDYRSFQSRILT